MRRRAVIGGVLAGAVVAFGGAVAGLSAATAGKIATGVHVGSVELGGLTPTEATDRLRASYVASLQRPVVVTRRGKQFSLSAKEARITADVDGTVAAAVAASDQGNAIQGAWKAATGARTEKSLQVKTTSSRDAVLRFVDRVRRGVDRKATDATLTFVDDRPVVSASKTGMAVDRQQLRRMVEDALLDPARKQLAAPVKTQQPSLSEAALRKQHQTIITVDRGEHILRLFKNFKVAKRYDVAVGMQGLDTPAGTYTINDKQDNPSWHVPMSAWAGDLAGTVVPPGPSNPIKARWMGFFDGAGIHGTSDDASIGSSASHGCVRMHVSDVIDLYPRVPVGATINVV